MQPHGADSAVLGWAHRLLSEAAAQLSDEDMAAMEASVAGYPIELSDVQSGLDLQGFFSRWGDDVTAVQQAAGSDTGARACHPQGLNTPMSDCNAAPPAVCAATLQHQLSQPTNRLMHCVQPSCALAERQRNKTPWHSWAAASEASSVCSVPGRRHQQLRPSARANLLERQIQPMTSPSACSRTGMVLTPLLRLPTTASGTRWHRERARKELLCCHTVEWLTAATLDWFLHLNLCS